MKELFPHQTFDSNGNASCSLRAPPGAEPDTQVHQRQNAKRNSRTRIGILYGFTATAQTRLDWLERRAVRRPLTDRSARRAVGAWAQRSPLQPRARADTATGRSATVHSPHAHRSRPSRSMTGVDCPIAGVHVASDARIGRRARLGARASTGPRAPKGPCPPSGHAPRIRMAQQHGR